MSTASRQKSDRFMKRPLLNKRRARNVCPWPPGVARRLTPRRGATNALRRDNRRRLVQVCAGRAAAVVNIVTQPGVRAYQVVAALPPIDMHAVIHAHRTVTWHFRWLV